MNFNKKQQKILIEKAETIKSRLNKIAKHKKRIKQTSHEIVDDLWQNIENWRPVKDEKAVCFSPSDLTAWYVWFAEPFGEYHSFKETPTWEKTIRHYYNQSIEPQKGGELVIIPLKMFNELNVTLKLKVWNKLEDISR